MTLNDLDRRNGRYLALFAEFINTWDQLCHIC